MAQALNRKRVKRGGKNTVAPRHYPPPSSECPHEGQQFNSLLEGLGITRRLADIFTIFPVKVSKGCIDVWVRLSQPCVKQGLEFSKRCSRELVQCRGVVSVEGGNEIISVHDVGSRFPSRRSVTFPFDKVLYFSSMNLRIKYHFNFKFILAVNLNRPGLRWGSISYGVIVIGNKL